MKKLFIVSAILLGSFTAIAQTEVTKDDMRCGKIKGKTLGEFKEELVNSCDLNKPFSTSLSQLINDDTYLYCCHKKK